MERSLLPSRLRPMPDSDRRGCVLIAIARESLAADPAPAPCAWSDDWLREYGASFVTLRLDGELRGCIGSREPRPALGDDGTPNAQCAAPRGPRFLPSPAREREFPQ